MHKLPDLLHILLDVLRRVDRKRVMSFVVGVHVEDVYLSLEVDRLGGVLVLFGFEHFRE